MAETVAAAVAEDQASAARSSATALLHRSPLGCQLDHAALGGRQLTAQRASHANTDPAALQRARLAEARYADLTSNWQTRPLPA